MAYVDMVSGCNFAVEGCGFATSSVLFPKISGLSRPYKKTKIQHERTTTYEAITQ